MTIEQLPWPKSGHREIELSEDLYVGLEAGWQTWRIPKGTKVKLVSGRNFGYVVTPSELNLSRRIFKW